MRKVIAVGAGIVATALAVVGVAVACPPRRPPPPQVMEGPRGRITITTTPHASVAIDGRSLGQTPILGHYLDPGPHRVRLRASCGTIHRRVYVAPAQDVQLAIAICPGARVPAK